ncbi:MAG: hypothetical protein U9Q92_01215 [archaeon]|nr:hypothetical protein [archaeon]
MSDYQKITFLRENDNEEFPFIFPTACIEKKEEGEEGSYFPLKEKLMGYELLGYVSLIEEKCSAYDPEVNAKVFKEIENTIEETYKVHISEPLDEEISSEV